MDFKNVITEIMKEYAATGRVFFNEAHFQYEFTLELFNLLGSKDWRYEIEYHQSSNWKIDLVVTNNKSGEKYAIEFKYKTKAELVEIRPGLIINLKNQSAQDESRYNCWMDISRIEELTTLGFKGGFFLFITNDEKLIQPVKNKNQDYQFDISAGSQPKYPSPLSWKDPNLSTAKKYPKKLYIKNSYTFEYSSYEKPFENYKYLVVPIE